MKENYKKNGALITIDYSSIKDSREILDLVFEVSGAAVGYKEAKAKGEDANLGSKLEGSLGKLMKAVDGAKNCVSEVKEEPFLTASYVSYLADIHFSKEKEKEVPPETPKPKDTVIN